MNREDWYLTLAVVISLVVIMILALEFTELYHSFTTEFLAVALGLLLSFGIDRKLEAAKKDKDKTRMLHEFRNELEETKSKLTGGRLPNRLRVPIWDSALAAT